MSSFVIDLVKWVDFQPTIDVRLGRFLAFVYYHAPWIFFMINATILATIMTKM